jgi:murein DD-endopeptidase MepM/ murein hydrolase activator NlpD
VAPGDLLGEVGTTGRSTGNHLHWDLLVGTTWVDGLAWLEGELAGESACQKEMAQVADLEPFSH